VSETLLAIIEEAESASRQKLALKQLRLGNICRIIEEKLGMAGTRKGTTGKSGTIKSTGGQNKPVGGTGGGGGARGQANLSTLGKTTPGGRGPVPKAK
jgi:hypothetical protein